jgi:hypothetical protein
MVTTLRRCVVDEAEAAAAEGRWRAVVDAQRDDLALLRARWPDRASPASLGAIARLRRRAAAGGEADEAIGAVHAAYGGPARVPAAVRRRLERYAWEQLGGRPWPERTLSESTEEPSINRKRRRGRT